MALFTYVSRGLDQHNQVRHAGFQVADPSRILGRFQDATLCRSRGVNVSVRVTKHLREDEGTEADKASQSVREEVLC